MASGALGKVAAPERSVKKSVSYPNGQLKQEPEKLNFKYDFPPFVAIRRRNALLSGLGMNLVHGVQQRACDVGHTWQDHVPGTRTEVMRSSMIKFQV